MKFDIISQILQLEEQKEIKPINSDNFKRLYSIIYSSIEELEGLRVLGKSESTDDILAVTKNGEKYAIAFYETSVYIFNEDKSFEVSIDTQKDEDDEATFFKITFKKDNDIISAAQYSYYNGENYAVRVYNDVLEDGKMKEYLSNLVADYSCVFDINQSGDKYVLDIDHQDEVGCELGNIIVDSRLFAEKDRFSFIRTIGLIIRDEYRKKMAKATSTSNELMNEEKSSRSM